MASTGEHNEPDASQLQRMVLPQAAPNFLDPTLEWRRIFAETWGTFLLVVVAAGGSVVAAQGQLDEGRPR